MFDLSALSSLCDSLVHDHKPEGLLGHIVGRMHSGRGQECEVLLAVLSKSLCHVEDFRILLLHIPLDGTDGTGVHCQSYNPEHHYFFQDSEYYARSCDSDQQLPVTVLSLESGGGAFLKKLTSRVERGLVGSPLDLGSADQKHTPPPIRVAGSVWELRVDEYSKKFRRFVLWGI
jgi:hypothetical protein